MTPIKNYEFTHYYLDEIINVYEEHTIDEWLYAFEQLFGIMSLFHLNIDDMDFNVAPDIAANAKVLKLNLAENEHVVIRAVRCFNRSAEVVLNKSIELVQASSKEKLQYDDVSELIKTAWKSLISFFDESLDLDLDIFALCLFSNLAKTLEKSVKIVADELSV